MAEEQAGLFRRSGSSPGACGWFALAAFGWLQALTQRDAAEFARKEIRRRAYAAEMSAAFHALDANNLKSSSLAA
jgi:hypothetical protein